MRHAARNRLQRDAGVVVLFSVGAALELWARASTLQNQNPLSRVVA